jgi:hypothetical protein
MWAPDGRATSAILPPLGFFGNAKSAKSIFGMATSATASFRSEVCKPEQAAETHSLD